MPRYQDQLASGVLSPKRCSTESPLEVWEMAIFLEMWREQSPTLLGQDVRLVLKLPGVRGLGTVSSLLQEFQPQRVQMCPDGPGAFPPGMLGLFSQVVLFIS